MSDQIDYNKLFSDIIKKQISILGPDITLSKARNVAGISIDDTGTVSKLEGDPHQLLQNLTNEFLELSSDIVKQTIDPVLADYPEVASKMEQMVPQAGMVASSSVSSLDIPPAPVTGSPVSQEAPVATAQQEQILPTMPNSSSVQPPAAPLPQVASNQSAIVSPAPISSDVVSSTPAERTSPQTTELSASQSPGAPVADEANDTQLNELNEMFKDPTMTPASPTSQTTISPADTPPASPTEQSKKQ